MLRISDPERSLAFYQQQLGMTLIAQRSSPDMTHWFLGFANTQNNPPSALLELRHAAGTEDAVYSPDRNDTYWKIGITLPDVDLARQRLLAAGTSVDEPRQFVDVGYLCHCADPDGHAIELLQHRFAQNHQPVQPQTGYPLGSTPTLGQITLRAKDPDVSLNFYCEQIGMRLLSRQTIEPHGFTLYFLACTDDEPPHADVDSVDNREWLWQRPYTTLELQHIWGTENNVMRYRTRADEPLGCWGIGFTTAELARTVEQLADNGAVVAEPVRHDPALACNAAVMLDPDGMRVRFAERAD